MLHYCSIKFHDIYFLCNVDDKQKAWKHTFTDSIHNSSWRDNIPKPSDRVIFTCVRLFFQVPCSRSATWPRCALLFSLGHQWLHAGAAGWVSWVTTEYTSSVVGMELDSRWLLSKIETILDNKLSSSPWFVGQSQQRVAQMHHWITQEVISSYGHHYV